MATFSAGLKKNYISPSMMISSPSLELHLRMQRADAKSSLTPSDGWLISPLHHHKDTSNCTPTVNHWSPLPEVCAHSTL